MKRFWILATLATNLVVGVLAADTLGPSEQQRKDFLRPETIPFPRENPYTPIKATLGKMLFFDSRLSRDRNLSCASCHNPSFGWEVPFDRAIGAGGKPLGRHAPTVINLAWGSEYFWDGRAASLEDQARGPIEADVEMDLPMEVAVQRIGSVRAYNTLFERVFPDEGLTEDSLLKALATYERTLMTGDTPFDRWLEGESDAISPEAKRGFDLFVGKANCSACHTGWNFTDNLYHDVGLDSQDTGRLGISRAASDTHAFKTPGLREIAARAPYMHNGSMPTLLSVMAHYQTGGRQRPSLSKHMGPLALTVDEITELVEFLETLSSVQSRLVLPNLPVQ